MTDHPHSDHDRWVEVERYRSPSDAQGGALALAAIGISSRLIEAEGVVVVLVAADDALAARRELVEYGRETSRAPPPAPAASPWAGLDAALAYASILIVLHVAATRMLFGLDWLSAGAAEAGAIDSGALWRAVTALTLHADLGHLASNLVAGVLLGMLLAEMLGPGLAWLAILAGGSLGNILNALLRPAAHTSIGASTAVFVALGLMAALSWRRQASRWRRRLRRLAPLAAGVMLLAFLGFSGERTDVGAHVAGFAIGAAGGAALHLAGARVPHGPRAQRIYGLAALALLAAAWIAAFAAAAHAP